METTAVSTSSVATYTARAITSYTNLGPMTSPLSFPDKCRNSLYDMQTDGIGVSWTYYTQGCALSECCPSSNAYTAPYQWYSEYYSPGVCPSHYQTCNVPTDITSRSRETAAFCCPDEYDCGTFKPGASQTGVPAATEPQYNWFCQKTTGSNTTVLRLDDMFHQSTISTLVGTGNNFFYAAYPLQIRWKEGDFDAAKTTGGGSRVTPAPAPAQSVTSGGSKSTSAAASSSQTSQSLSTGAIAAIAVVIGVVLLAALGVLVWWLRKKSLARNTSPTEAKHTTASEIVENLPYGYSGHGELEAQQVRGAAELEARERLELEARDQMEAKGRTTRAEIG